MKEEFLKQMQEMLKDEFPAYLESLSGEPLHGLRVNLLKSDEQEVRRLTGLDLRPSVFCGNGFLFDKAPGFGVSPAFRSGIVYLQEPSASAAVSVLKPEKGLNILDLCAAPGSKTTQIAEQMGHTGFLCANEYVHKRSLILQENIVNNGTANCMILNADTADVADAFHDFFDMVLCDAPCSGEGMFRKNDEAVSEWSFANVKACAARQAEILHNAWRCLKKDGILVYSTCTFNTHENEETIRSFLQSHPDMKLVPASVSFGRKGFGMDEAVRIFPMDGGEGHFICRMQKCGGSEYEPGRIKGSPVPSALKKEISSLLERDYPYYLLKDGRLYGGCAPFYAAGKCRIICHQVFLGEWNGNRFEPSHHLFMSAYAPAKLKYEMSEEETNRYLCGEQLPYSGTKGYYSMCWHGHPLGGAKCDGKYLKNRYPKYLRLRAR